MAGARRQDLLGRLADLSEEAIQRLSDAPGADRFLQALNSFRERLDELQRRVRGLEELERRLAALEKKVERLSKSGAGSPAARRGTRTGTGRAAGRGSSAKSS
jgi:DNA repair exonuclease SbcCD ATPase subunit